MDKLINKADPTIMHIDLNSCFATVEQQANPFLRGKPIAVAAYTGNSGCVISPSIEAKKYGVKVGMRVREAKEILPSIEIVAPDPPKYRAVHLQFCKLFRSYTPHVTPLSIDEAVMDLHGTPSYNKGMIKIGEEIKWRMRKEIGEWISCNVGISTNRFLAKTAASLNKPDGLDVITHKNLREVYSKLELIDLCGINVRYQIRLNAANIFTPIEFFEASLHVIKRQVFKSVVGISWYKRLRGWEIDNVEWGRKTYGQSYALHKFTGDITTLAPLLMKLCEKMGRRLRRAGYYSHGIHVGCLFVEGKYWHEGKKHEERLYSSSDLYKYALKLLMKKPSGYKVTHLMVNCYDLHPLTQLQMGLFDESLDERWELSRSMDNINDRYGEYVVFPARMFGLNDQIIDRVPFGGVKELVDIYSNHYS